jgi:Fe-S cluster biogenesis protein NfuA/nitrite reductase/ring-hydroxylating ferredoxin subunit
MSPPGDTDWSKAGERIQTLLDASAAGGAVVQERAEQLVREVTDLYGAGLERMMRMAVSAHPELGEAFTADPLVASLLLVHGLHPQTVERRVADALDSVRPYLGSHGGDVDLLEVTGDAYDYTVRLRFAGSCKSCPSSSVTLELAVKDAIKAAAPEVSSIEVVAAPSSTTSGVIPTESLLARVHTNGHRAAAWQPAPELAELAPGEVGGYSMAGVTTLACRVGGDVLAYRDHCPVCSKGELGKGDNSLAGARLDGALLRCPRCGTDFDMLHAGAGVGTAAHLEPIPVLVRDGVLSVAVPQGALPQPLAVSQGAAQ